MNEIEKYFEKNDIIIGEQSAICVYVNQVEDIVIRQINNSLDDDSMIFVRPENIPLLIKKLAEFTDVNITIGD